MPFGKKNISKNSVSVGHAISRKRKAFLRNTANKHCVVNVVSTEIKKAGCNVFEDSDIAIIMPYNCNWLKQGFSCGIVVSRRR